jgi:cell division transport system ATP-binding protein
LIFENFDLFSILRLGFRNLEVMIKLDNVSKKFGAGNTALDEVSFSIDPGEFVFVVGPSGSGKTTLFRLLIREMMPTSGSIFFHDVDISKISSGKLPHLRKRIGVVFQDLKLLRDRTILENILFPLEVANVDHKEALRRVDEILEQVGIAEHKLKFPVQLSGGELQRAAIARALAFGPEVILADEPTGNLDNVTSWEIVNLLLKINEAGTTVLMATHNTDIVNSLLKRVLTIEKGKLTKDEVKEKKEKKEE